MNGFANWLETAWVRGYAEDGINFAIEAGLAALPIAMVVLLLDFGFRRWLTAGQRGALWCLVFARLLIPSAPASPLSLHNLISLMETSEASDIETATAQAVISPPQPKVLTFDALGNSTAEPVVDPPTQLTAPQVDVMELLGLLLPLVWLAGAMIICTWTVVMYWRFCRRVRRVPVCHDARLLRLWDDCCSRAKVNNRVPIILFDGVPQPAVMGLIHTSLLLPCDATELSDEQLEMIMLHELAHIGRRDIAVNWGLVILRSLHWWNPVFWLASTRFLSLREQACDAFVIHARDGQPSRNYSELLLTLAARDSSRGGWRVILPAALLGIFTGFFRKRALRQRLCALRKVNTPHGKWHTFAVSAIVLLVAVCGLTDAESPVPTTFESIPIVPQLSGDLSRQFGWQYTPVTTDGERPAFQTRVYVLDSLMNRYNENLSQRDEARGTIEFIVGGMLGLHSGQLSIPKSPKAPTEDEAIDKPIANFEWEHNRVLLHAPPAVHDELAQLIDTWETSEFDQICIECRLITSPRELATAAGISWQTLQTTVNDRDEVTQTVPRGDGTIVQASSQVAVYPPLFVVPLAEEQVKSIMRVATDGAKTKIVFAPKITIYNGQSAMISDCVSRPFVVGLEIEGGGLKPRIKILEEGIRINLRAVLSADRRHTGLDFNIQLNSIPDVANVSASTLEGVRSVQVPQLRQIKIGLKSEIENGNSLLVGCLPHFDQKDCLYILLTPRKVSEEAD